MGTKYTWDWRMTKPESRVGQYMTGLGLIGAGCMFMLLMFVKSPNARVAIYFLAFAGLATAGVGEFIRSQVVGLSQPLAGFELPAVGPVLF